MPLDETNAGAVPAADPLKSLKARYWKEPDAALYAPHVNQVVSTLLSHRSVRSYLSTPLPEGALETLVAAAQSAASSSNLQTWSVIAVENGERRARLAELANHQQHIKQAPLLLVWLADFHRLGAIARERGVELEALRYTDSFIVAVGDAALAAQNAVVAAESLGLGTVYIGALRNNAEKVAAELKLPPHIFPVFGLVVGYPDPATPTGIKPRLSQQAILHREEYLWDPQPEAIAAYDASIQDFQREQGIAQAAWTDQAIDRLKTPQALNGRERIRDALDKFDIELR